MGKFRNNWATQSEIGKKFGVSAVAVGKILNENGLRDLSTKLPSEKAMSEEWCVSTPLKDGTPHYMWSIKKVEGLIGQQGVKAIDKSEQVADEIIRQIKTSNRLLDRGEDKLAYLGLEAAFDEVAKDLREKVAQQLISKGYAEYAKWVA
jgi:hypothetical protein